MKISVKASRSYNQFSKKVRYLLSDKSYSGHRTNIAEIVDHVQTQMKKVTILNISIRNGKIVWKVARIKDYLGLNLSSQNTSTQDTSEFIEVNTECAGKSKQLYSWSFLEH